MRNISIEKIILTFDDFMYGFTVNIIKKYKNFLNIKKKFDEKASKAFCILLPLFFWIKFIELYKSIDFSDFLIFIYTVLGLLLLMLSAYYYWGLLQLHYPKVRKNRPLLFRGRKKNAKVIEKKDDDCILLNNILDENSDEESLESKLKSFFNESMYEEFKIKAIESKILDNDMKWIFKKEQRFPVVLFHFLSERKVIKEIEIKLYCEISNLIFGLRVNHTMYSKPAYKKIREIEFNKDYSEFLVFAEY